MKPFFPGGKNWTYGENYICSIDQGGDGAESILGVFHSNNKINPT